MTPETKVSAIRNGFTLIEMMIVIGIIALLAALTLGISNSVLRNSEISRTQDTLRLFEMALHEWELEMGRAITFRDFSSLAGIDDPFGQGQPIVYRYDITSWVDINGTDLNEPLLVAPSFGGVAVDDAVMMEAMETRMRDLVLVLLESESAADILQRITPSHFFEMDLNNDGAANEKVGVDAWGTPIGIVFPCQQYANADLNGNTLPQDECGDLTVRDQAEDGLGSCINRQPYFVSAGPDRLWGYRYQASSPIFNQAEDPDWLASIDNVYSYEPYLVEESR